MQDQWEQWANNITSAAGSNSDNIYQNYATAGVINAAPEAIAGRKAAFDADNEEIARKNAETERALKEQRELDAKDPNKAQMKLREDGMGYEFFDGTGKQISINEYSLLTGRKPDQLLEDSDNPRDQKFVQDYRTMNALSSAWVNGDRETLAKFRAADPEKFNQLMTQYKTPKDMVQGFMNHWSQYYNPQAGFSTGTSPSFAPQNINAPSEAQAQQLAGTTLEQITTPTTIKPPEFSDNWFKRNLFESAPILNRLSGQRDARRRFQEELEANPWASYQMALQGTSPQNKWYTIPR